MTETVYIVDGARTPFLKARTHTGPFSSSDLAVACGRNLLLRQPFSIHEIDEVVIGSVISHSAEPNVARVITLRLGGEEIPAFTVQRNCASGLQALDTAKQLIAQGTHDLVLAGGTDDMSRSPVLFPDRMANWIGDWVSAKSLTKKLETIAQFRPSFLKPTFGVLEGLTDPIVHLNMGQTAENLAYQYQVSRAAQDAYALASQQRTLAAAKQGLLHEIVPIFDANGLCYDHDDGVRPDTSLEKLANLKPIFDKKYGTVTAGNSSQITDGAALLILASEKAVKKYQLPILARVIDTRWAALSPAIMGLGPYYAINKLLDAQKMKLEDVAYYEINEAFAAQVLACYAAWEKDKTHGVLNSETVNIDGGAIAIGHPVGASGARLVLHLAHTLQRKNARFGIASLCIGGGQGGAMLIENINH